MDFDRHGDDVGNIIALEHVNLRVLDLYLAQTFYVNGLGCTHDPYIVHRPDLVWFNMGEQQFHVPLSDRADVLRGVIHLVLPSLSDLLSLIHISEPTRPY